MGHKPKEYKRDSNFWGGESWNSSLSSRYRVFTAYPVGDHIRQASEAGCRGTSYAGMDMKVQGFRNGTSYGKVYQ